MKIRVRSVIIKDNKILLIKRTKKDSVYWVIPGGGVEKNETNEEALIREGEEELGVKIKISSLLLETLSKKPETEGQKELFYLCDIIGGVLRTGQGPEFKQNSSYVGGYNIERIKISDLKEIDLKPEEIKDLICKRF